MELLVARGLGFVAHGHPSLGAACCEALPAVVPISSRLCVVAMAIVKMATSASGRYRYQCRRANRGSWPSRMPASPSDAIIK
jgi:hypothetical protein